MLLTVIVILGLAYIVLRNTGMMGGGSGESTDPNPMDQARITAAIIELRSVRTGLVAYKTMRGPGFPGTAEITSLDDLRSVLAEFMPLQPEPSFRFASYTSASLDTFVMTVRAKDTAGTVLLITPSVGPKRLDRP
jgi:hypothetical protein